jgi:hypothetical protein
MEEEKEKDEKAECSICQNLLSDLPPLTLQCKHSFHYDCIYDWSESKKNHMNPHTGNPDPQLFSCPLCRFKFPAYLPPFNPFAISRENALTYIKMNALLMNLDGSAIFGDNGEDYPIENFGELPFPDLKLEEKKIISLNTTIDTITTKLETQWQRFNTQKQAIRSTRKKMITSAINTARLRHQLRAYQQYREKQRKRDEEKQQN